MTPSSSDPDPLMPPEPVAPSLDASLLHGSTFSDPAVQQLADARRKALRQPDGVPALPRKWWHIWQSNVALQPPQSEQVRPRFIIWQQERRARWGVLALVGLTISITLVLTAMLLTHHGTDGSNSTNQITGMTTGQTPPTDATPANGATTPPAIHGTDTPVAAASPTTAPQSGAPPTATSPVGKVPTATPQPGAVPTNPPPAPTATATPVSCPTIDVDSSSATISGDDGQSGSGTTIGTIVTTMVITRTPNGQGGCGATSIQQLTNVQLLSGSWNETNGPNCSANGHTCGIGGSISQWNAATPGNASTFTTSVVYGIWNAPWGPRWVYSADDPTPQAQNDPQQQQCALAVGYYNDNFNVRHASPQTPLFCWVNG